MYHVSWRVVQYTCTVMVRISHVSIHTDRTDQQNVSMGCKVYFTVRKSHLISGMGIFSWKEWLYTVCRSEQIDKRSILSVKCILRSANRISLVEWEYFHGNSGYIRFVDPNRSTKGVYCLLSVFYGPQIASH